MAITSTDGKAKKLANAKPKAVRALVRLEVTGFEDSKFPSDGNLSQAVINRGSDLGYEGIGTVTISNESTEQIKYIDIAAVDIEPLRLAGILDDVLKNFLDKGYTITLADVKGPVSSKLSIQRMTKKQYKAHKQAKADKEQQPTKRAKKVDKVAEPKAKKSLQENFTPLSLKTMKKRFCVGGMTKKQRKIAKREIVLNEDSLSLKFKATGGDGYAASEELYLLQQLIKKYWSSVEANIQGDELHVRGISDPVDILATQAVLTPFRYSQENDAKLKDWLEGGGLGWVAMWVGDRGLLFYGLGDLKLRDPPLD